MTAYVWRWLAAGMFALALLFPTTASAKGIVVVTWGETITPMGSATAQVEHSHASSDVGYKWGYFGVFWIDLWTHGGTHCVYTGDRYSPISSAEAARLLGKNESDLTPPFLY